MSLRICLFGQCNTAYSLLVYLMIFSAFLLGNHYEILKIIFTFILVVSLLLLKSCSNCINVTVN